PPRARARVPRPRRPGVCGRRRLRPTLGRHALASRLWGRPAAGGVARPRGGEPPDRGRRGLAGARRSTRAGAPPGAEGPARRRAEWRPRGVASPLIEAAVASLGRGDQLEPARRLARRRVSTLARVAPDKAATRLRDYLLRRGFPGTVVTQVVRESLPRSAQDD